MVKVERFWLGRTLAVSEFREAEFYVNGKRGYKGLMNQSIISTKLENLGKKILKEKTGKTTGTIKISTDEFVEILKQDGIIKHIKKPYLRSWRVEVLRDWIKKYGGGVE